MRIALTVFVVLFSLLALGGCAPYTGFVPLAAPSQGARVPPESVSLHASLDIGRPYAILGYVYRQVVGLGEGATDLSKNTSELQYGEDVLKDLRQKAASQGADAIVGLNLDGAINGYGQPICTSVGGWAVKLQ